MMQHYDILLVSVIWILNSNLKPQISMKCDNVAIWELRSNEKCFSCVKLAKINVCIFMKIWSYHFRSVIILPDQRSSAWDMGRLPTKDHPKDRWKHFCELKYVKFQNVKILYFNSPTIYFYSVRPDVLEQLRMD